MANDRPLTTPAKDGGTSSRIHDECGLSLLEVLIGSSMLVVTILAMATSMNFSSRTTQSISSATDFNSLSAVIQSVLNSSSNCATVLGAWTFSPPGSPGPISPEIPVSPLRLGGSTGAVVAQLGSMNSLNVTQLAFTEANPTGTPNQYLATLTVSANKVVGGGAVGVQTLSRKFPVLLTIDPAQSNKIIACQGQSDSFWKLALASVSDIYYSAGKVGIGLNTGIQAPLHVAAAPDDVDQMPSLLVNPTLTFPSRTQMGVFSKMAYSPSAAPGSDVYPTAIRAQAQTSSANNNDHVFMIGLTANATYSGGGATLGTLVATHSESVMEGSGTITVARGSQNIVTVKPAGSGTIVSAFGADSGIYNQGATNITDAVGLRVNTSINAGGGTITNLTGLRIHKQNGPGISATYGIEQLDAGDRNYFAGNVGIGVSNPAYQLHLSTDSAAKPGTSTWTIASDARLKTVRAPFTRGLAALDTIHPVYFRYNRDNPLGLPSAKEYVGILAQDAQKAVPEAVETDEQGFLHLTNDAILWTILNSVSELYHLVIDRFSAQDRALASFEARLERLEAENAALKAQLARAGNATAAPRTDSPRR